MDIGINTSTPPTDLQGNLAGQSTEVKNLLAATHSSVAHDPDAAAHSVTADAMLGSDAPGPPVEAKPRMKRMTLNDAQKYEICIYMREEEERSTRPTNKAVAAYILNRYHIKVDESTVSRLKSQATSRLSRDLANPLAKRHRQVVFPELERLLGEYVQANKRKVVITDAMLLNRGKELREMLNIPEAQMKFSDGWLNKFKVRHGLKAASVHRLPRAAPTTATATNTTTRRTASGSIPDERPRQQQGAVAISLDDHNAVDMALRSSLQATSLNPSSSSMDRDRHHMDDGIDLGSAMDVDQADNSHPLSMEHALRQHQSNHVSDAEVNTRSIVDQVVNSCAEDFPSIQMEVLASVYGHPSASGTATQADIQRHQASRLLGPNHTSRNISKTTIPSAIQSARTSSPQLESILPLSSSTSTMDADALAGLGLSASTTAAAAAVAAAAAAHSTTTTDSDTGNKGVKAGAPVTAARASLTMRMTDPIAAAFQPEPPVDFAEAAQCVFTLRIFMKQQNFNDEQVEHLRQIYLTLDNKKKQQAQEQEQQRQRQPPE